MNPPNPKGVSETCSDDGETFQYMHQISRNSSRHVEHAPDFALAPLPIAPENESFTDSDNFVLIELSRGRKTPLCLFPCEERLRFLDWEEDDFVKPTERRMQTAGAAPPCQPLVSQTFESRLPPPQTSQQPHAAKGRGRLLIPPTTQDRNKPGHFCIGQPPPLDIPNLCNYSTPSVDNRPQTSNPQHQFLGSKPHSYQFQPLGGGDKPSFYHMQPHMDAPNPFYHLQPSQDGQELFPQPAYLPLDVQISHPSDAEPPGAKNLPFSSREEALFHELNHAKVMAPQRYMQSPATEELLSQPCPPFKLHSPVSDPRNKLVKHLRIQDPKVYPEHGVVKFSGHQNFNIGSEHGPVEKFYMQNQYNQEHVVTEEVDPQKAKLLSESGLGKSLNPCASEFYPEQSKPVLKSYPEFRRDPHWTFEYAVLPISETSVKFGVRGRGRLAERKVVVPREGMPKRECLVSEDALTGVDVSQKSNTSKSKTPDCNHSKTENTLEISDSEKPLKLFPSKSQDCASPRSKLGTEKGKGESKHRSGFTVYVPPPARKVGASPEEGTPTPESSVQRSQVSGDCQRSNQVDSQKRENLVLDKDQYNSKTTKEVEDLNKGQINLKDSHSKIQAEIRADMHSKEQRSGGTLDTDTDKCCELINTVMVLPKSIPYKESCGLKPNTNVSECIHRDASESMSIKVPSSVGTHAVTAEEGQTKGAVPKSILNIETCSLKQNAVVVKSTMVHQSGDVELRSGIQKPKGETSTENYQKDRSVLKSNFREVTCGMDKNKKIERSFSSHDSFKPKSGQELKIKTSNTDLKEGTVHLKPTLNKKYFDVKQKLAVSNERASSNLPGKVQSCKPDVCSIKLSKPPRECRDGWKQSRGKINGNSQGSGPVPGNVLSKVEMNVGNSLVCGSQKRVPGVSARVESNVGKSLAKVTEYMSKPAMESMRGNAQIPTYGKNIPRNRNEPPRADPRSAGKELLQPILRDMQRPFGTNRKPGGFAGKPVVPKNVPGELTPKIGQFKNDIITNAFNRQNFIATSVNQMGDQVNLRNWGTAPKGCDREGSKKAAAMGAKLGTESTKGADILKDTAKISSVKPFPDLDMENRCLIFPAVPQESCALFPDLDELLQFGATGPT